MNILKQFSLVLFISFAIFYLAPQKAHAQQFTGPTAIDGVEIAANPALPSPGQNVTISLTGYSTDLNRATITWYQDQKVIMKKNGLTSIDITAPLANKSTTIMASILTPTGATIQKIITVQAGDVDLLWETTGYAPSIYRGQVPFVYQNTLKVTAFPHLTNQNGQPIDPANLIYTWKKDDQILNTESGYGKQMLTLSPILIPRPFVIRVDVSSSDGKVAGENSEEFTAASPSISFYEEDPLYGVLYNKVIGDTFNIIHNEVKVLAVPYGFDIPKIVGNAVSPLVYTWSINNTAHQELSTSRRVVLGTQEGVVGSSLVNLSMQDTGDAILQGASAEFTAVFGATSQNEPVTF